MMKFPIGRLFLCAALFLFLSACSPAYDWREVRGADPAFTVVLPAKPTVLTRSVDLDGIRVAMTMTLANVAGNMFAVGAARLPRPEDAPTALNAMKLALLKNIGGKITAEKSSGSSTLEIEAIGLPSPELGGQPRFLAARFVAVGDRVYEVAATGGMKSLPRETVDTFLTSFKPE